MDKSSDAQWRLDGVRVVHSNELDINTAQTPGMNRAAAITYARVGAEKLWAGTVVIHPKAKTGAHHHGAWKAYLCGQRKGPHALGRPARVRRRGRPRRLHLRAALRPAPGDQRQRRGPLACVMVRSGQEPVVVNLDLPNVEQSPEPVEWVDDLHPRKDG